MLNLSTAEIYSNLALPTSIDLIRPVRAFELRQRLRETILPLVHTEEITMDNLICLTRSRLRRVEVTVPPSRYHLRVLVATWILAVATAILAVSGPVALLVWLNA